MTREDTRRENARELASLPEGRGAFGRLVGMDSSQISQIIGKTPSKNIGNSVARRIEKAFDKPEGWLDVDHRQHIDHPSPDAGGNARMRLVRPEENDTRVEPDQVRRWLEMFLAADAARRAQLLTTVETLVGIPEAAATRNKQ